MYNFLDFTNFYPKKCEKTDFYAYFSTYFIRYLFNEKKISNSEKGIEKLLKRAFKNMVGLSNSINIYPSKHEKS